MLVVPASALSDLMGRIVSATHSLTDTAGDPQRLSTIDPRMLRTAALTALQIATGEVIFPGDETLVLKRAKPTHGPLSIAEG